MRAAFRNTIAAAVAAAIAISGATVAHADEAALPAVAQVDSDSDGLPDIWEERGVVLTDGTEIPLPDWGADPNRPDLFLQLNWMVSEYDTLDCDTAAALECAVANHASYAPSKQSLDDLVALFDDHGISLHIDAGEYYTNIDNYAEVFGGETLDYRDVYFDPNRPEGRQLIDVIDNLGERANIFRAGILGDRMRAGYDATGLALVNDNAFYVASPEGAATDTEVRNSILHEFGHTLGLRHWGAAKYVKDFAAGSPMQDGYHSVMNYDYQFDYFNYSEQPYFADTPKGKVFIPADWDSLEIANTRIGVYAESIGARADITDKAEVEEVEKSEEIVETTQPEPVEVAEDHETVELVPAADAQSQPGVTPTKPAKDEPKAEAKAQPKVEEVKPAKAEAPKQADNQLNIAAIIGGIVAALAALGIGAAFFAMR